MDESILKLKNAPIIEAVLDIECDMPPSQDLKNLEAAARESYRPQYPKFRAILMQEHRIDANPEAPQVSVSKHSLQGFQLLQHDEKQLVQVRAQGFSFNRLAPYSTLEDYLPEMERTWNLFMGVAKPVEVRLVRLRYINRILLPAPAGKVILENYLNVCPHLPDEEKLEFVGFLSHHAAVEKETQNQLNIILAAQSLENEKLPIIFDITVARPFTKEPGNWAEILTIIRSLRNLKNRVFRNTLTQTCINLFQGQ